jgi:hypothetical protein
MKKEKQHKRHFPENKQCAWKKKSLGSFYN